MRKGFIAIVVLFGITLPSSFSSSASAQSARQAVAPKGEASAASAFNPRELSGVWTGRERNTTGNEISPLTPWGREEFDAHKPFNGPRSVSVGVSNDPMIKCDPLGFPRNLFHEMRAMELIQTPAKVVQLFQYQSVWRQIWTDGRELPKNAGAKTGNVPDPQYYGYSVGKWDGDTFVVNTVGLDDSTWLDVYGDPHSADLRVEERYTRQDHDTMKLTVMVDDPQAYSRPFMAQPGEFYKLSKDDLPQQLCIPSEPDAYLNSVAGPAASSKVQK